VRDILRLGLKLLIISAVGGLALGLTNAVTEGPIAAQQVAAADEARKQVLPGAETFEALDAVEGLDEAHAGRDGSGALIGLTGKITAQGYGGPIEVTVGVGTDGAITGVSVGGADFKETAGLGARTKEPWFAEQFAGKTAPVQLKQDGGEIDAVASATISSSAVTQAVDAAAAALAAAMQGVQ